METPIVLGRSLWGKSVANPGLHPPGGATALIAVIGSQELHALGYLFVLVPVGLGAVLLLIVGLLINNLSTHRRYPEFWL